MNKKRLNTLLSLTLSTVFMTGFTSTTIFADQLKEKKEEVVVRQQKPLTFEDFMKKDIKKKGISEKDLTEIKKLYSESIALRKEGKIYEADTLIRKIFTLCKNYEDSVKTKIELNKEAKKDAIPEEILHPSFEDFMKHDIKKKDVSKKDLKTLKELYTKFIDSLKTDNLDSAKLIMDEFMKIANKYEDLYKSTYVAPKVPSVEKIIPQEVKYPSFEDFMKNDIKKKDISKEDMEILKSLYSKYVASMKEEKFDSAKNTMAKFNKIADKYENLYSSTYVEATPAPVSYTPPVEERTLSFDEFIEADLKIELDEENYAALSKIYSDAIELKKEGKYERYYELIEEIFNLSKDLVE